MNKTIIACYTVFYLLCPATLAAQELPEPSIRVEATPKQQLSDFKTGAGQITIRVSVPPSPQNRAVCIEVDGTTYRRSCWESHATDRLVKEFRYPSLQSGTYVVTGSLVWWDEKEGKAKTAASRDIFEIRGGNE